MQVLSSRFYRPNAMRPPVHAVRGLGLAIKRLRLQREMTQEELRELLPDVHVRATRA